MSRVFWTIALAGVLSSSSIVRSDVLAYWRFEDHPAGDKLDARLGSEDLPLSTTSSTSTAGASTAVNGLRTFNTRSDLAPPDTCPTFVGQPDLPKLAGGVTNARCARFVGSEDLYTAQPSGNRPPIDSAPLRQFTIEGMFKLSALSSRIEDRFQTVVGKDGKPANHLPFQPFVAVIAGHDDGAMKRDCLSINIVDRGGNFRAIASQQPLEVDHWYAFAAVCDGQTLKLMINRFDGHGYTQEADGAVEGGIADCTETWTVGRGMFDRGPNSWLQGYADEIRISDDVLPKEKWLTAGVDRVEPAKIVAAKPIAAPTRCVEMLADPVALLHDGVYYLYGTGDTKGFDVYTSRDLQHWTKGPRILQRGEGVWGDEDFWAPGIIERGGKFYLYYSAVGALPDAGYPRTARINIAVADSPSGPFKEVVARLPLIGRAVIDPQPFIDDDGKAYLYFVGDVSEGRGQVYVVRLNDDLLSTVGEPIRCVEHSQPWEGPTWNEGPFVFEDGDTYLLMYSGEFWASPDYSVGLATSPSPLGPWKKSDDNPFLHRYAGLLGTGHNCVVRDPSGKGWLTFFAAQRGPGDARRDTYFARLRVDRDARKNVILKPEPWEPSGR